MDIECGGFIFVSDFDSGNIGRVELIKESSASDATVSNPTLPTIRSMHERFQLLRMKLKDPTRSDMLSGISDPGDDVDYEFNIWTRPDCSGTEFENGNRTWFHFGIRGGTPYCTLKLNIMNLNKQSKMYSQGMTPVYRILPGKSKWERIKDKPSFHTENNQFTLSFKYQLTDTFRSTVYFAFTYPFSYTELQQYLNSLEIHQKLHVNSPYYSRLDDIYYHRELVCHTLQGRRVDLITVSSYHNMSSTREARLSSLFPEETPRPFKFINKKVVFLSARVHPGETPSSHVLNGMINLLTSRDDIVATALRKNFVFKIIPMLNPDGVFTGNYRTDTRGVNLNRVYSCPNRELHPSIYAARALIRYHHHGEEIPEPWLTMGRFDGSRIEHIEDGVSFLSLEKNPANQLKTESNNNYDIFINNSEVILRLASNDSQDDLASGVTYDSSESKDGTPIAVPPQSNLPPGAPTAPSDSGLYLYIDMHGHASKKGMFMYGNHFDDPNDQIECMLLPKLVSLNSQHFNFESCNFSEKNMYIKDKRDGSSREGCGRVGIYKATGLIRSYTLECNYNTGKVLNVLAPASRDHLDKKPLPNLIVPPKYTPNVYEEVGRSILMAVLDQIGVHPFTRLNNTFHHNLGGVRDWLRHKIMNSTASSARSSMTSGPSSRVHTSPSTASSNVTQVRLSRSEPSLARHSVSLTGSKTGSSQPRIKPMSGGASGSRPSLSAGPGRRSKASPSPKSKAKRRKLEEPSTSAGKLRARRLEKKKTGGETRHLDQGSRRRKKLKPK